MRAPAFWRARTPSLAANLLRPFGHVYGAVAARRLRCQGERVATPVICIGNFTAGGAGKTPTTIAIGRLLQGMGESPAFLTRGYGGRLGGPLRVEAGAHSAADVGDEPLLLAPVAPTIVARDRPAGARLAVAERASAIVMDDGLQNPSLGKDLSFAVVDAESGLGNGLCLPAGPLRAPLNAQWTRVDAVILVGEGEAGEEVARDAEARGKAVFRARLEPDPAVTAAVSGRRVLAFAGIGRPEKFFTTLEVCGAVVARKRAFPDHHPYAAAELRKLHAEAEREGLLLVTTEKDLVRLPGLGAETTGAIVALPVTLAFADEEAMRVLLASTLSSGRRPGFANPGAA